MRACESVVVHVVATPLHAPVQPLNIDCPSAIAVKVTDEPNVADSTHFPLFTPPARVQAIVEPPVTSPPPLPESETEIDWTSTKRAVTAMLVGPGVTVHTAPVAVAQSPPQPAKDCCVPPLDVGSPAAVS